MLIIRHHIIVGQHSKDLFSPFLLLNICEFFFTDEKNFSLNYHKVGPHEPYILFGIFPECSRKPLNPLKFLNVRESTRMYHMFENILENSTMLQNVLEYSIGSSIF
jgi:hypothetical protein